MNNTIKIPGLEDVIITKVEEFEDRIAIFVEMEVQTHICPKCGKKTRKIHDYRVQKIKHLKWFERLSYIFYRERRDRCDTCGKRVYEKNSIVGGEHRWSQGWEQAGNIRSVRAKTFKEMAGQMGTSPSALLRRSDERAK